MARKSHYEEKFHQLWMEKGLSGSDLEREYKFCPDRAWRFDFAFPSQKLAIDIQGMGRSGGFGGHQSAQGMRNDCEKYNTAVLQGWRVLLFPSSMANVEEWVYFVSVALCYPDGV